MNVLATDNYIISQDPCANTKSEAEIKSSIERHEYDVVVLGSGHRYQEYLPIWELVCRNYDRDHVIIIDGGDSYLSGEIVRRYYLCSKHFFSREGPDTRFPKVFRPKE